MFNYESLLKIGFSINDIDSFIKNNRLSINENGMVILDYDLLIKIINMSKDKKVIDFKNEKINIMISNLFRLIRLKQNKLAYELALRIKNILDIPEINLIIENIDTKDDNIEYIFDDKVYTNDVIVDGLKNYERSILVDLYSDDFVSANKRILNLAKLYVYQNPIVFSVYKSYLISIKNLKFDHSYVGKRKYEGALGSPESVLGALLRCEDFLRAHEVVRDVYSNDSNTLSIAWEIFKYMDELLMDEYKENKEHLYKQMELNSNGLNTVKEIVRDYRISSLTDKQISDMVKKYDYSIDYDKNYYNEYLKHKEEGSYEEARNDIIKFQRLMGERGIFCDYDYLIKETDILLYNQTYDSKEDKTIHDKLIEDALLLMELKKYTEAIELFERSFNYESKKSISTYSKIGECYMELGDYYAAANTFKKESHDYLYPIDYLHYIESLYRIGEYENIFDLADAYEYYYPEESAFVHYILAICYVMKGNYKLALDQIDTCEIISAEYYNLGLNYNYERSIIKDLGRGKDVEPFSLDDYYEHCFSKKTLNRINSLDLDNIPEDGSLLVKIINENSSERIEDQLEFLLKLSKVLKEMNRRKDAYDLLRYIEDIIKTSNLSSSDNEHFTVVLKNYKNL